jgi:hypothetical protein
MTSDYTPFSGEPGPHEILMVHKAADRVDPRLQKHPPEESPAT